MADAAGDNAIHHQPVPEARIGGAQGVLAQDSALREHQRERCIVADRADVSEMVCQSLHFSHQRTQIHGALRYLHVERGFHRARECYRVGDRAVARGSTCEASGLVERRSSHQRPDPLVHVAEPLLQPHDGLAIGGEPEMSRFDDAGVHRTNGDLM